MTEKLVGVLVIALADINHDGTLYGPGREAGVELRLPEGQVESLENMGFVKRGDEAVAGVGGVKAASTVEAATAAIAVAVTTPAVDAPATAVAKPVTTAKPAAKKKPAAKTTRKPKA